MIYILAVTSELITKTFVMSRFTELILMTIAIYGQFSLVYILQAHFLISSLYISVTDD